MGWDERDTRYRDPDTVRGMQMLGAAMRRQRRRRGWSQRDLERETGVHQTTISRFENGTRCGMSWKRFAMVVSVLDGLDFEPVPTTTFLDHQAREPNPYLARLEAERLRASAPAVASADADPPQPLERVDLTR